MSAATCFARFASLALVLATAACGASAPDPAAAEKAAVTAAVDEYFDSWSRGDMTAYRGAFHPAAIIFQRNADGTIARIPVEPFVDGQAQGKAASAVPMEERPTSTEISRHGDFATAFVRWKLTAGARVETGVDAFTFVREGGKWKIISLVYGADPAKP